MDASEINSKKLSAKEVIFLKEEGEFYFPIADGRINPLEEIKTWEHPPLHGIDQFEEESHLDFSWRIRRVSSTTSWLISGCRWSDTWFLVHVRKLHIPPSRWTKSETLLAERRIVPYSTEVHWRLQNCNCTNEFGCLSKSAALTITGTSMGQEMCLILGQVSLNLFYWKKKPPEGYMWSGRRLTRKTAYIQARSFMARTLGRQWERMPSWRRSKSDRMKSSIWDNARKLRGIYFIDPEDTEFKETIKNARKKLETSVSPCYALQKLWRRIVGVVHPTK